MSKMKICDFIDKVGDGIHGTPKYDDEGTYFFINGNNLVNGKIEITNETLKISDLEYERIKRPINNNTLLLSINGTLGKIAVYNGEKVALGKSVCFINVKEQVNKYFIKYILSTKEFQKYIQLVSHGSTIKNLAPSQIADYEFNCCNYEYQDKMVFLLKSLDEKIDNNNKINEELESMAKTIYDYWFLQFEFPNEEGKPYKSSGGKMVWNEELKREIPKGWKITNLLEANIYTSDFTANGSFAGLRENVKYNEGEKFAVLVRIVDFNNNFNNMDDLIYVNKHAYDYLEKSNLHGGEIIICNVGNAGAVYRCPDLGMPMTLGPNGIVVNSEKYNDFLYLHYKSKIGQKQLLGISSGSIQLKFNKTNLRNLPIVLPDDGTLNKFNSIYKPINKKINQVWYENKELVNLRDFLIPLLINGQVGFRELALAED